MYKKKVTFKLENKYNSYQNTGTVGSMMQLCHKGLEGGRYLKKLKDDSKILEIGAGTSPHVKFVKHKFGKYFFLETSKFAISFLKKKLVTIKNLSLRLIMVKKFPSKKITLIEL